MRETMCVTKPLVEFKDVVENYEFMYLGNKYVKVGGKAILSGTTTEQPISDNQKVKVVFRLSDYDAGITSEESEPEETTE